MGLGDYIGYQYFSTGIADCFFFVSICTVFVRISYTLAYGRIVLPCILYCPFCIYSSVSQLLSKVLLLASSLTSTSLFPLCHPLRPHLRLRGMYQTWSQSNMCHLDTV
ncbi:hypothetical protein EDD18DRAFT_155998 [Armillaria luteobubalina]|uniref:Uncharacterized protein n=1 Tax=Armillaria luteobubalina TaxID=153913 RepID=A0AA39Q8W0_9AGAR|nr:hypothetical protein EDD18DRAFT_155998 [Armillaria luteobubalina]